VSSALIALVVVGTAIFARPPPASRCSPPTARGDR
jgi:hypothetical protein